MANYTYRIDRFHGIDQSRDESLLSPAFTPDAMNMDASDGGLTVTKGYSKYIREEIPPVFYSRVDKLCFFKNAQGTIPMAITGGFVYTYDEGNGEWVRAYTYPLVMQDRNYSVLMTRIGQTDVMLIADGANRILKFDGTDFSLFGSEEGCSDIEVSYIAMYRSRLFAAGNFQYPNRLYYSKLPGGERSIEDWGPDQDSPSVEGGHIEIGTTTGDPITALAAMSNQLLIFKKYSVYRLIGDRPGNFTVELIERDSTPVYDAATAVCRDLIYYVTDGGLHCFNGVSASLMPDSRMIRDIMNGADTSDTRLAIAGDRLFFTIRKGAERRLIEYDMTQRRYMQYGGFDPHDIVTENGRLIIVNGDRFVERWGEGNDFDGVPIAAYWTTPLTDLGDKAAIKTLRGLYLRGENFGGNGLTVSACVGVHRQNCSIVLPKSLSEVAEAPLKNEGRAFRLILSNRRGGRFRLVGGIELEMSVRKRTN